MEKLRFCTIFYKINVLKKPFRINLIMQKYLYSNELTYKNLEVKKQQNRFNCHFYTIR